MQTLLTIAIKLATHGVGNSNRNVDTRINVNLIVRFLCHPVVCGFALKDIGAGIVRVNYLVSRVVGSFGVFYVFGVTLK